MRAPSALRACVALLAVAIATAVAPPPPSPSPPPLPPGASLSVSPLVVGELAFSGDTFVNAYTPAVRNAIVAAVARATELPLTAVTVPFEFYSAELTLRLAATSSPVSDALLAALATAVGAAANVSTSVVFPVDAGAGGGGAADVDVAVHTATAAAAATAKAALTSATAALLAAAGTAAGSSATLVGTIDRAVVATFRAQLPIMSTPRTADAAAAVVVANITLAVTSGSLTTGFAALQAPVSLRQGPVVNKVLAVLDPSRPPPNSAPPRSLPPPRPPPPAPGAAAKPTYVGKLSKQQLSAIIICSACGAVGCCVVTALCACASYRRGVTAAEIALQRDIAEHKLAPPPRQQQQTTELESVEVDDLATDGASAHDASPPPPSPPARRTSRLGPDAGDVPAPHAEITPAQAGSSPRASLTSSSPRVSLSSDTRRLSSPGSRGAALLAASEAEPAASPRLSQQTVAEPIDDAPPVAQPHPPWATSSFDNPLRHDDDEAHEAHEDDVASLGSPHQANVAAWHALGSPEAPSSHGDGHNPLFDDATPHPAWEQLAPASGGAATPSSDSAGFDAFASPSEGGAAFATPGSALSDGSVSRE